MQFCTYDCFSVNMGTFFLDGGGMFGVVPKTLWEKKIRADEKNRIPMKTRSLVIRGAGKTILVDAGIGDKLPEKQKKIYGLRDGAPSTDDRLAAYGLCVEDFTDVIITHLHFDHVGGCTRYKNGKVVPSFPNAVYHTQKAQLDLAIQPSKRDKGSYIPEIFVPLAENGQLRILDGPAENYFEGIDILVTNGHTQGQQHLLVKGADSSLFYCADLIPTAAHLPIVWNMAYDNHPLDLLEEKGKILQRASAENWVLCFEHDPVTSAARIQIENGVAVLKSVVSL